jgi:hypothetical protein
MKAIDGLNEMLKDDDLGDVLIRVLKETLLERTAITAKWHNGTEFVDVHLAVNDHGQYFMHGAPVRAFVDTYVSIGGPKARLMWWNEEDLQNGFYEPWNTWYAAKDMDAAKQDALSWAHAEDVPAIV